MPSPALHLVETIRKALDGLACSPSCASESVIPAEPCDCYRAEALAALDALVAELASDCTCWTNPPTPAGKCPQHKAGGVATVAAAPPRPVLSLVRTEATSEGDSHG